MKRQLPCKMDKSGVSGFSEHVNSKASPSSSFLSLGQILVTKYVTLIASWLVLNFTAKIPQMKFLIEVWLCNLTLLILSPIVVSVFGLNFLVRKLISTFVLNPKRHKLIDGIDAVWAPVYPATVPNLSSLYVIEGNCDIGKIRKKLDTIAKHPNYARLKYRIIRKFGYFTWEDVSLSFDIRNHVKILPGCDSETVYSESEVFEKIGAIYDTFMSDERPQWEVLLVPKYKYNKDNGNDTRSHYAMVFRIHHSILDGVSAGLWLQHAMADYPVNLSVDPLKPLKISWFYRTIPYVLMAVIGARSLIKSLMLKETNCFHGKPMTGPKYVGWSRPVNLNTLKQVKTATNTSTTAVLISCFGGALRSLAQKKNLEVPSSIYAAATVAMLPYPNIKFQNRFTSAHVPIEIGLPTQVQRLKSAFKHANNMARSPDILMNYHMMQLTGAFPAIIVDEIMKNLNSTMLLSNVPGPAEDVYMFGGDKLVDAVAWGPFKGVTGNNINHLNYLRTDVHCADMACFF